MIRLHKILIKTNGFKCYIYLILVTVCIYYCTILSRPKRFVSASEGQMSLDKYFHKIRQMPDESCYMKTTSNMCNPLIANISTINLS